MRSIFQPVVTLLDRLQFRLARSRSGSVLILTVVMVVLLALLGTALLSTTRNDRYVSAQHTENVQIDMLMDGVKNLVKSAIVDDLFGTFNVGGTDTTIFRPPLDTSSTVLSTYDHWDAPYLARDNPKSGGAP
ncbi:MAG TPA: hypothetical protein VH518_05985, partial [Tepidisphaeraceae bacterium]